MKQSQCSVLPKMVKVKGLGMCSLKRSPRPTTTKSVAEQASRENQKGAAPWKLG
ncbi:hypothetical protein COOONC_23366 [Cooperia oncophora]